VGRFPDEELVQERQYYDIVKVGSTLYFSPLSAKHIAVYDIERDSFEKIMIPLHEQKNLKIEYKSSAKFGQAHLMGDCLYFIPLTYPGILCCNIKDKSLTVIDDWMRNIESHIQNTEAGYFSKGCIHGGVLYVSCLCCNAIFEFNFVAQYHKMHTLGKKHNRYNSICSDGKKLWVLPFNKERIFAYNPESGETTENLAIVSAKNMRELIPAQDLIYVNKYVYVFPAFADNAIVLKINSENGMVNALDSFNRVIRDTIHSKTNKFQNIRFLRAKLVGNVIYAFSGELNSLVSFDADTEDLHVIAGVLSEDDSKEFRLNSLKKILDCKANKDGTMDFIYESEIPLGIFLDNCLDICDSNDALKQVNKKEAGSAIYDYVKKLVTQ